MKDASSPGQFATPGAPVTHLTAPSELAWSFWRIAECRSAGFPVTQVIAFTDTACAKAADKLLQAEAARTAMWDEIRRDVKGRIKGLLEQVRVCPKEEQDTLPQQAEIRLLRLDAKAIDRRRLSAEFCAHTDDAIVAVLEMLEQQYVAALARFEHEFAAAQNRSQQAATQFAQNDYFREAVTWQNPKLVGAVLDVLAQNGTANSSKLRRSEEVIASYAQRYCTKNDTIGFFGPVGWAQFATSEDAQIMQVRSGAGILSKRSVYFEDWAMTALVGRLSEDQRLLRWMTPKRMPYLKLENQTLSFPGGATVTLSKDEAALLALCDGCLPAQQIAQALLANPFLDFDCEQDVFALLQHLTKNQRVSCSFVVCVGDAWPERYLQTQIAAIEDSELKQHLLQQFDKLQDARQQLSAAAGKSLQVGRAIEQVNACFESFAAVQSNRRAGETYGARTIVYEDCRRDMQVTLGNGWTQKLQPALDLVLSSARWFCYQLGRQCQHRMVEIFRNIQKNTVAGKTLDFPTFWLQAQALFFGDAMLDVAAIQNELATKWQTILGDSSTDVLQQFDSSALREAVLQSFAAPDCGWRSACHQSPDVMLAATDPANIAQGEGLFVLGEVHLGLNTLINHSALNQAPDAEQLLNMLRTDRGQPRIIPLLSREGAMQPIRVQTVTQAGYDIELCFSHDARPLSPSTAMDIVDLSLFEQDEKLLIRHQDGRQFAILDVFGELLSGLAASKFKMFDNAAYRPRMVIDQLVIQRQSWRFSCGQLPFVGMREDAQCYLEVRQWCQRHAIPTYVFVKLAWEQKPFYVDLSSPLYVRMLAKQIRNALQRGVSELVEIGISEMLPLHQQSWLPDATSQRYTSEFRLVAVHQQDCNLMQASQ